MAKHKRNPAKSTRARRRHVRKLRFRFWFWGVVLGVVLGIFLCRQFRLVPAVDRLLAGDIRGAVQTLANRDTVQTPLTPAGSETENAEDNTDAIVATPVPTLSAQDLQPEQQPTKEAEPLVSIPPETPAPDQVVLTTAPTPTETPTVTPTASPTSDPTPAPIVLPTDIPATATPAPTAQLVMVTVPPTLAPQAPAVVTPRPVMTWAPKGASKTPEQLKEELKNAQATQPTEVPAAVTAPENMPDIESSAPTVPGEPVVSTQVQEAQIAPQSSTETVSGARSRKDPVSIGQWYTLTADLTQEGTPSYTPETTSQQAVLSLRVTEYLSPAYYQEQYASTYQLYGSEAAIALEIRNDSDTVTVVPESAVRIAFADKADVLDDAYPLMDAPLGGTTEITLAPGASATVYKRFAWHETAGVPPFLTVDYAQSGTLTRAYIFIHPYNNQG